MAITLAGIWLLYDLTAGKLWDLAPGLWDRTRRSELRGELLHTAKRYLAPAAILVTFAYAKTLTFTRMVSLTSGSYSSSDGWYRNYSPLSISDSYGWYLNALFHVHLYWGVWMAVVLAAGGLMLFWRARTALFLLGYTLISFLPSAILSNHRFAYYWYIPSFGLVGLAALAVKQVSERAAALLSDRLAPIAGSAIFALACAGNFFLQHHMDRYQRAWAHDMSTEYRSFVTGLRSLPPPRHGETVYFKSVSRYFDETSTRSALQVAFHMADINARIVHDFPQESRYRVRFEGLTVTREGVFAPTGSRH